MVTDSNKTNSMNLHEWLQALKRHSTMMILIFVSVAVLAVVMAFLWPATYQASGTILIEQQEVPAELVRSTISSYADQRIQVITQQVMTTDNLSKIIQKYDLYYKQRRTRTREYVLERMRDDVDFKMISADVIDPRSGTPTKATIAFSIGYKSRSPDLAAKVANEIVSLYLQQNIDSRRQRTADATSFLTEEADRLNRSITEQQARLAEFKQQHISGLPEQSQLNIQMMARAEDELRDTDTSLRALDQQLVYLDAQLAQINPTAQVYTSTGEKVMAPGDRLKYLRSELSRAKSLYSADHPDVLRMSREVAGLEATVGESVDVNDLLREFQETQSQLQSAQQRYAADHPDVIKLQRGVVALQQQINAARQSGIAATNAESPDNPAYIQLSAQRQASGNERTSLMRKREELERLVASYERRLAGAPAVEREYTGMIRELENNQLKYREVRQKQMEAEVAQNLEDERKGERFTLIEPPLTPTQPASPNRILLLVMGFILALASGPATVVLLESANTCVRNRRDLQQLLQVPPLAVLPWIDTEADRLLRWQRRRYALIGSATSLMVSAAMLHFFYRPLDVLWQVALRRIVG